MWGQNDKVLNMTILSWNVNGIRAVLKKGFLGFLKKEKPDIICLQEIKIDAEAIKKEMFDFPDYEEFYNPAERKGYSGTAVLVKSSKVKSYKVGLLPKLKWDDEGRIQVLDLGEFYLANIYFPNANHELSRLDFKINDFSHKLLLYFNKLNKVKPLIACGDFNVAHEEIDLARPKDNVGNPGFTNEERAWMTKFLRSGYRDAFRSLYPNKTQYSWWSYRFNARTRNLGWRIDYFCVSTRIMKQVKSSFISDNITGSDHAPVGITI